MVEIVSFSPDLLAGWYSAKSSAAALRAASAASALGAGASSAAARNADPDAGVTPPWDVRAKPEGLDVLSRQVLGDGVFFRAQEFTSLKATDDTKTLFTLHQGLKRLYALASEAQDKATTDIRRSFLERRFQEGMKQFETFLQDADLETVSLARGVSRNVAESAVKIARGVSQYVTPAVHEGEYDAAVEAFQGDVAFTIAVTKNGATNPIAIDLAEMGGAPRTMDAVAAFINGKLEAEGVITRFERVKIGEKDENGIIPGNKFGFKISGLSTEKVAFSAAGAPSVYVTGISGKDDAAAGQVAKLNALSGPGPETGFIRRLEADPMIGTDEEGEKTETPGVLRARASATGPGGELYVLAETESAVDGAVLKGERDLVLLKYDSTGRRIWSRVLGAADSAAPADIAVAADGSVAITGRIDGALGDTIDKGGADGFVAKYSAQGAEQWLQRFGTGADDVPAAIALGAGGEVYVGGRTGGTLGAATAGGQDGFVRAFGADGSVQWTRQIGTAESDAVTALAVDGAGNLLVASGQNGEGVVAKYGAADGDSAALWTHSLGELDYGDIAALAVDEDGAIYLAGKAGAGADLAQTHPGHAGARDAYLARLSDGGDHADLDYATFLGSENEDVARDIAVTGGAVYLTGRTDGALPGGVELVGDRNSFAARFDAADGALAWTTQIAGRDGMSEAYSLALDPTGDSVLDALGLPRGTLDYGGGALLTERSAAREGDHFYVAVDGGRKRKITLDKDETYLSLTFKINAALVLDGKAQVGRSSAGDSLKIKPNGDSVIELFAGSEGRDALAALGLEAGAVRNAPDTDDESASAAPPLYALGVPSTLSIAEEGAALKAFEALDKAMSTVRRAYRELHTDPALKDLLNRKPTGPAPAHLLAQLSNFQAGLARLNAGPAPGGAFLI